MRLADVYLFGRKAGRLEERDDGIFCFRYYGEYLASEDPIAVSLTMPLGDTVWESPTLMPFFDGLIPEGWLLDVAENTWKIDRRDRMGLLLACCRDCIGAASIREVDDGE